MRRLRSYGCPVWRSHHASMSVLPGPVSKPRTGPPGGKSVMLAMPPILITTRCLSGSANTAAWNAGTSGAPLAAGGNVAAAKIRDHGNARRLGQPRRIGKLSRVAQFGAMANRLPVQPDRGNVARLAMRRRQDRSHGGRACIHERVCGERAAMDFVLAASLQGVQLGAQIGGEGDVGACQCAARRGTEIGQHRVDAVDAGARHDAYEELGAHRSRHAKVASIIRRLRP